MKHQSKKPGLGTPHAPQTRISAARIAAIVLLSVCLGTSWLAPRSASAQSPASSSLPIGELPEGDSTLFTGTVVHRVPLELPSARGGLVPTLAVFANHQLGDGILGTGWGLEGLSRVERRSATYGVATFGTDGTEDTFWVDGELLVSSDADYRLEHDDNRVFSQVWDTAEGKTILGWQAKRDGWTWTWGIPDTSLNPNDEFAVEAWEESGCLAPYDLNKDGHVDVHDVAVFIACAAGPSIPYRSGCATMDYDRDGDTDQSDFGRLQRSFTGRTLAAAQLYAGPHNVTWLLSHVKDPHGNEITYQYDADCCSALPETTLPDGEYAYGHKISQITYGNGNNSIHFEYTSRKDARADASLGRLRLLDCRLQQITVKAGSETYSNYEFHYDGSETGGLADLTLLSKVYRVDPSDGSKEKLLRSMTYNSQLTDFSSEPVKTMLESDLDADIDGNAITPLTVNFDGNAWPDLVILQVSTLGTALGHIAFRNVENTEQWSAGSSSSLVKDRALTGLLNDAIDSEFLSNDGAFQFIDIDRDGATELLLSESTSTPVTTVYEYDPDTGTYPSRSGWASVHPTFLQFGQFADIDGDGFADLIISPLPTTGVSIPSGYDSLTSKTHWIRNSGTVPYLDDTPGNVKELLTPIEDPDSTASKELADKWKSLDCDVEEGVPTIEVHGSCFTSRKYTSTREYLAAQARWADFNADGVADVAYAFYLCWDMDISADLCSSGMCSGLGICPSGSNVYSRIFFGDGRGGFHDTGAGAGPPFLRCRESTGFESGWDSDQESEYWAQVVGENTWRTTDAWGTVDVDRSGHLSLLHQHIQSSGAPKLYASPDIGLPSVFGLDDVFAVLPGEHYDSVLPFETLVPGIALADLWPPPHFQLLADWDGDGFADVLRVYDLAVLSGSGESLPFKVKFYANQRTVSRGRLESIRTGWATDADGYIRLSYQFSTDNSSSLSYRNSDLPYVGEFIKSVEDEQGTRTFWFGNGRFDTERNRSMGFGDALVYHDNGRTTRLQFSTERSTLGSLLTRAEYAADNELEFFSVFRYHQGTLSSVDLSAPYFNPLQGRCDYWLAGPADPNILKQSCCDFLGSNGPGPSLCGAYECGDLPGPVGAKFAALDSKPDGLDEPDLGDAIVPTDPPTPVTEYLFLAQEWEYDSDQRPIRHDDHRDTTLADDDIKTTYDWGGWDSAQAGKQLETITRYDAPGNLLGSEVRSNFADFNQPRTVTQYGPTACGALAGLRAWTYEYLQGDVQKVTDPEGNFTTYARNLCGQITLQTDAARRDEEIDYGADCRETQRRFEGMIVTTGKRDGFGRVVDRTTNYGSGEPDITEHWTYDDSIDSLSEPRAGVVYSDGSARLQYLDEWGREVREEEGGAVAGSDMPAIDPSTMISRARGYDVDGNLRFVTRPYAAGDNIAATWYFADEFGRNLVVLSPAHVLSADATASSYVVNRYWHQPRLTIDRDPVGQTCRTDYDTLHKQRTCEGIVRSSEKYDVLGNVISQTDGDGIEIVTTYDPFFRPCTRQYATPVELFDGSAKAPLWSYEYDNLDRLQASVDPEGNRTERDYDGIGRVLQQRFIEYGTAAPVVVQHSVFDDYSVSSGSRSVTTTDVNGNTTTTYLDGGGRTVLTQFPNSPTGKPNTETRTYDNRGRLASVTNVDELTVQYAYDEHGRLEQEVGPDPTWVREVAYNAAGDLISKVDRDGVKTSLESYWSGKLASMTRTSTTGGTWTLGSWIYRKDGRPLEAFEGGVSTGYTYDTLGRRNAACIGMDSSGTCGIFLGYEWTPGDRLKKQTRGGSLITQYVYNPIGWLNGVVHPDTTSELWDRDIMGRARRHTDEEGVISEVDFDGWGRKTQERLPGMGPRSFAYTFGASHPYFGQVEEHTLAEPDAGVWKTLSDYAGRIVQQNRPDLTAVMSTYEGSHLMDVREGTVGPPFAPLARVAYKYDTNGQLESRWGPVDESRYTTSGGTPGATDYVFAYSWTPEGRRRSVAGPNDDTQYTWSQGVLTMEQITGVTNKAYSYDSDFPRLASVQTGTAAPYRTQRFQWERGLWLSQVEATDGTATRVNVFSSRDAYGTPLYSESNLDGASQVAYTLTTNSRGRVATTNVDYRGSSFLGIRRNYYDNGYTHQIDVTWSATGDSESLIYDRSIATGFVLTGIRSSTGHYYVNGILRDPLARPVGVPLSSGRQAGYDYDLRGRVTTQVIREAGGASLMQRDYTYDTRSRLSSLNVTRPTGTRLDTYGYVEPGWLASEHRRVGTVEHQNFTYTYDVAGNRIAKKLVTTARTTETKLGYDYGNRLKELEDVVTPPVIRPVTWNDYGDMIQDRLGQNLIYDPAGEPGQVLEAGGLPLYTFVRDAAGLPVGAILSGNPGGERKQVWGNPGGGDWPLAGVTAAGKRVLWVVADGILVARVEDGVPHETAVDPSGSLLMFDATFLGETGSFGDAAASPPLVTERHLYAGLEDFDGPYMSARHRLFDPDIGQFTSKDPIGQPGGDLRFAYTNNNPLTFVDPAGLSCGLLARSRDPLGLSSPAISFSNDNYFYPSAQPALFSFDGFDLADSSPWDESGTCRPGRCVNVTGSEEAEAETDPSSESSDGYDMNSEFVDTPWGEGLLTTATPVRPPPDGGDVPADEQAAARPEAPPQIAGGSDETGGSSGGGGGGRWGRGGWGSVGTRWREDDFINLENARGNSTLSDFLSGMGDTGAMYAQLGLERQAYARAAATTSNLGSDATSLLGSRRHAWHEAARAAETRRSLEALTRSRTPLLIRTMMGLRNRIKYGDPLGPTVDQFRASGKTAEQVIASAGRTNRLVNAAGRVARPVGGTLLIAGTAVDLYEVGTGLSEVVKGEYGVGGTHVVEGGLNAGFGMGTAYLMYTGVAPAAVAGPVLLAGVGITLGASTFEALFTGQPTPLQQGERYLRESFGIDTHFSDIYGWTTGVYSQQ